MGYVAQVDQYDDVSTVTSATETPKSRLKWFVIICCLVILIMGVAAVIVALHYRKSTTWNHSPEYWSNKTTVILVTLSGFRSDYLDVYSAECENINLRLLRGTTGTKRAGVRTAMYPVFPTETSTNIVTLMTGQYASDHGILNKNVCVTGKL